MKALFSAIALTTLVAAAASATQPGSTALPTGYRGTLTFAREGPGFPGPSLIVDYDLQSRTSATRFDGIDPFRASTGETAFLARLEPWHFGDHGVVVADAGGVTAAPLYVCEDFNFNSNAICRTPKLSPDRLHVAFAARRGGGNVCYEIGEDYPAYGDYVIVHDRTGSEIASFEGYYHPEWLPDGRLLMLGSSCRGAGVWIADSTSGTPTRIDGNQVGVPGSFPTVSPDGTRLAFVWNRQLWMLTLDGRQQLTQLTQLTDEVQSAAWSPDGTALALLRSSGSWPLEAITLFRPGDPRSVVMHPLDFLPYGPITWR